MFPIKIDWTINPTVILTAIIFLFGCVGSWYNLREEVHILKATTEQHLVILDESIADVKKDIGYLRREVTNTPEHTPNTIKIEPPDPRVR